MLQKMLFNFNNYDRWEEIESPGKDRILAWSYKLNIFKEDKVLANISPSSDSANDFQTILALKKHKVLLSHIYI